MSFNLRNALSNAFVGGGGGGGATLAANTFTGAQTLPAGVGLLPASSGGTNLGQYNLGFGTLRVRVLATESGSGASAVYIDQDFGLLVGSSGYIGFASSAASSPTLNDAFFTRGGAASVKMGATHATTPTNQTFSAHNVTTGTGASLTLAGGTGSVAGGVLNLATSATTGAPTTHIQIKASGVVNFASAAVVTETVVSDRTLAIEVGGTTYKICLKA